MIKAWTNLATRIDALSLRERVFLFVSLLVVLVALADRLWVAPAQVRHKQTTQNFTAQGIELQRLRDEVRQTATRPDPVKLLQDELAQVGAQVTTADQEIAALSASNSAAGTLADVLVHFLRRHRGLTLVRTTNLGADSSAVAGAVVNLSVPARPTALVRRGLELTVAGPYAELVKYVQALEAAMPQMRWGKLTLTAGSQPPELTLQVYVMESQP